MAPAEEVARVTAMAAAKEEGATRLGGLALEGVQVAAAVAVGGEETAVSAD